MKLNQKPAHLSLNKYRRLKTLQKKIAEVSAYCNVDIVMIVRNKKFDKFREFHTNPDLTADHIHQIVVKGTDNYGRSLQYERELITSSE